MTRAPRCSARLHAARHPMTTRGVAKQRRVQAQATRRRLWLDALPLELATHVALYVNHGKAPEFQDRNLALLALANVSDKQRLAVLEAANYTFELQYDSCARWNAIFKQSIRHLNANNFRGDSFLDLIKAPTLETAAVSNRSMHLKLIAKVKGLRELSIEFSVRSPVHYLLSALKHLDLRKLQFNCSWFHSRGVCIFDLFPTPADCDKLSALCPHLSDLEFICDCSKKSADIGRFVDACPQVRNITFNIQVSSHLISRLQSLDSVTLKTSPHRGGLRHPSQFRLATRIGSAVTGIITSSHFDGTWWVPRDPVIDVAHIMELKRCPRLVELDMFIANGGEISFPELSELRCLRLQWDPSDIYEWFGNEPITPHYAPPSDFFRRLMLQSPGLQELCLFRAKVSLKDLDMILKTMGRRLKVFGTCVEGQSEHPGERLLALINMLVRYNPHIRRLAMFYHDAGVHRMIESGWMPSKERILLAVKLLQRRCPQLDIKRLFQWLGDWLDESPSLLFDISEAPQ